MNNVLVYYESDSDIDKKFEKELKKFLENYNLEMTSAADTQFGRRFLKFYLKKETKFEGGWISVKDKLPEEDQEVLVYVPVRKDVTINRVAIGRIDSLFRRARGKKELWWFSTDENSPVEDVGNYVAEVTHWMPLPNTPK